MGDEPTDRPADESEDAFEFDDQIHPAVVGIGASAGGLAALKSLFSDVPPDSDLAWVVVVHLSPEHESHLPQLLQPHVRMPVQQVTETVVLEPNRVYVIPPNANLSAVDTHLRLSELEERRQERAPIDHFLRTLSRTHDGHAIGVILTGTGADGTLGLREIKEKGGLAVVQDPNEAEYDGMPQSAIATGLVDLVLPVEEIPSAIIDFVHTRPRVPPTDEELRGEERRLLHKIFAQIRARTGRDFSRYKRSTIMRRVARRMQLRRVEELPVYLEELYADPEEVHALSDDLLITVTRFFRDPEIFEILAEQVIPKLFEGRDADDEVRVWSVGCATGEEAYSLAILLVEEAERRDVRPRLQVFASDLHERSLERARVGYYAGDIEADVSRERLRRFFQKETGGYRIRKQIRDLLVFTPHNLLGDPPFSRLDMVACRNLLIYLQREVQPDVVELFHYALKPDGYLVLGSSETVDAADLFRLENKQACVYRRRNVPVPEPRLPVFPLTWTHLSARREERTAEGESVAFGQLHHRIVEQYAPPSVLVSPDDNVVHFSEHAGRYMIHPGGELTANIYKLLREELRIELRAALHGAREQGGPVRSRAVELSDEGDSTHVVLDVRPALGPDMEGFSLLIFDERFPEGIFDANVVEADPSGADANDARVLALESELVGTRQRLQGIIEEYETSQEEMKASNEELQSTNEELRSTMEELETSKEELQSMNEELQTVNQENRHKVEELAQMTADLQNLLAATQIATLFLDRHLRIMRFTPGVGELFNIRQADSGRPLADLTHRLGYADLLDDAAEVLARLVPVEREVQNDEGRWYLTRILPYRSTEDRIEGIVITFVDITQRLSIEAELRRSEERLRLATEAAGVGTWILEAETARLDISPQMATLMGYPAETSTLSRARWLATVHPDDRDSLEDALDRALARQSPLEQEFRIQQPAGEERWLYSKGGPNPRTTDPAVSLGGAAIDITELKSAQNSLRGLNETLEERVQERTAQVREQEEKVRHLAATLTMAEQQERRRVSRLLHDDLQQILYGIQMKLELARERASRGDSRGLLSEAARSIELLGDAVNRTRQLSVSLSPPVLEGEGLIEALRWLRSYMSDLHDLTVEVRGDGEPAIASEDMRILLFQVVRELLFNVAKHADTDEAVVGVDERNGQLRITVSDEGLGFDPSALPQPGSPDAGLGLYSSRERLRLHGGSMEIRSNPGEGTRVTLYIPLTAS